MTLHFDNSFASLPENFYTRIMPSPPASPHFVHVNDSMARVLGLTAEEQQLDYLGGYKLWQGSAPVAAVYAGHQFGAFVPRLGDGRALLLGEVLHSDNQRCDLVLKGGGKTPYSRMGDGRAVLRSSIREYVVGDYLTALRVPSTRALCLVGTNDIVQREQPEPAATIIRTAPSHVRFGSFEYFHYQQQPENVRLLADYVLEHFYPELAAEPHKYVLLFYAITQRTAQLMAAWQATGFVHGVMNTDNMSVLGITLDFGPYGFMERYTPTQVFNHTDRHGRYAYKQQPAIGYWNLQALAHAFGALLPYEAISEVLGQYWPIYQQSFMQRMTQRLGLIQIQQGDAELVQQFLILLQAENIDFTHGFLALYYTQAALPMPAWLSTKDWALSSTSWWQEYQARLQQQDKSISLELLRQHNPHFVPRFALLQKVIAAVSAGDAAMLDNLLAACQAPFAANSAPADFYECAAAAPTGLSCSS